jgi:hypothetical protein
MGTSEGSSDGSSSGASGATDSGSDSDPAVAPCDGFTDDVIWHGDIEIETSAQVRALAGIQCVTGKLVVADSELMDLSGLDALVRVESSLAVLRNETLSSVHGLDAVEYVGEGLFFERNTVLTVASLPSLAELGVLLRVGGQGSGKPEEWGNPSLVELDFPRLAVIHGDIEIHNNPVLASLDGLAALETVDSDTDSWMLVSPERRLAIINNATLPMADAYAFESRFRFDSVHICHNGGDRAPCG